MGARGVLDGPIFLGRIRLLLIFLFPLRIVLLIVVGDGADLRRTGTVEWPHRRACADPPPSKVVVVVSPHLIPLGDALESPPLELAGEGGELGRAIHPVGEVTGHDLERESVLMEYDEAVAVVHPCQDFGRGGVGQGLHQLFRYQERQERERGEMTLSLGQLSNKISLPLLTFCGKVRGTSLPKDDGEAKDLVDHVVVVVVVAVFGE